MTFLPPKDLIEWWAQTGQLKKMTESKLKAEVGTRTTPIVELPWLQPWAEVLGRHGIQSTDDFMHLKDENLKELASIPAEEGPSVPDILLQRLAHERDCAKRRYDAARAKERQEEEALEQTRSNKKRGRRGRPSKAVGPMEHEPHPP